jgi:hypothetical protein
MTSLWHYFKTMMASRWLGLSTRARTIAGATAVVHAERTMSLLAIFIVAFVLVVLAVVVLRFIGSRRPKSDPGEAEAIAMAEADRRREAARRPTGGTGMWQ